MQKLSHYLEASVVFFLSLFLFTYGLFDHEFIQFETRFALFVQEMFQSGIHFFPTVYGIPYPDYPAFQTVIIYGLAKLIGSFNILIAVLPSAIASALTVLFTFLLAAPYSKRWALAAVFFELFTYHFFMASRSVALDPFVTTAVTYAFYMIYKAEPNKSFFRLCTFWLGPILGFLFRGPIGFILPCLIAGAYLLISQQYRRFFNIAFMGLIQFSILMALLLSAAFLQGGYSFVHDVIRMEVVGRIYSSVQTYPFYYFLNACVSYAPTFIVALGVWLAHARGMFQKDRTPELRLMLHLGVWALLILSVFSIPSVRKIRYIMPMVPPCALIAGYLFATPGLIENRFLNMLRACMRGIGYALPFIGLMMIPAALIVTHVKGIEVSAHYFSAVTLLSLLAIFVLLIGFRWSKTSWADLSLLGSATAVMMIALIFIVEPINASLNRTLPFVGAIEKQKQTNEQLIFYKMGPDGEDIKYMVTRGQLYPVKHIPLLQPLFAETPEQILNYHLPAIWVIKKDDFDNLPTEIRENTRIVAQGRVGHKDSIAFRHFEESMPVLPEKTFPNHTHVLTNHNP